MRLAPEGFQGKAGFQMMQSIMVDFTQLDLGLSNTVTLQRSLGECGREVEVSRRAPELPGTIH